MVQRFWLLWRTCSETSGPSWFWKFGFQTGISFTCSSWCFHPVLPSPLYHPQAVTSVPWPTWAPTLSSEAPEPWVNLEILSFWQTQLCLHVSLSGNWTPQSLVNHEWQQKEGLRGVEERVREGPRRNGGERYREGFQVWSKSNRRMPSQTGTSDKQWILPQHKYIPNIAWAMLNATFRTYSY